MNRGQTTISKFLSLVLRHQPGAIGLSLDENGWTGTGELLNQLNAHGHSLTFEELKRIVANNDKKRFAFSDDFQKIRANQGHSVEVDLNLQQQVPPNLLYHGTVKRNLASIKQEGLHKGNRHHVHLSADIETAERVGMRYGKPVILIINAKRMYEEGLAFFRSENSVWLTKHVLPTYIEFPTDQGNI